MAEDLNDIFYFAQVVEHGGFAAAGRAIGLPRSNLSRRIGLLEERLGVRLIQRSTRRFAVTEIGQEYYRHCVAVLVQAEAAREVIERTRSQPQGIVRVSCPVALLGFQVGEMIARFMVRNPLVRIHLEGTNRRVDVIQEGFDIAIRVRFPPLEQSDLIMKVLANSPQRLVAAPALLRKSKKLLLPADLGVLPSLDWGSPQNDHIWSIEKSDGATALIHHEPRLVTEDMALLRRSALLGIGIAQLPTRMVEDDLTSGRLIDVLPGWAPKSGVIHAAFPSRRGLLPAVRGLLDFLATEFAAQEREALPAASARPRRTRSMQKK